jgi:hypothetical protein
VEHSPELVPRFVAGAVGSTVTLLTLCLIDKISGTSTDGPRLSLSDAFAAAVELTDGRKWTDFSMLHNTVLPLLSVWQAAVAALIGYFVQAE